jgi:hypothetical protein
MAIPDLIWQDGSRVWENLFTESATLIYFCEPAIEDAFIRQPADTYSNLGFLFVGVVMLVYAIQDLRRPRQSFVQQYPIWSFLYAAAMIGTFLGSAFFHASLSRIAEWVDLAAVFAAAWLPVSFNFHRLQAHFRKRNVAVGPWLLFYFVLLLLSCLSIFRVNAWWTFPTAIVMIGLSSVWLQSKGKWPGGWKWISGSMAMTFFAAMWFVFDIQRILCDADSWLQPHAIWHLCDAAAVGLFYGFMRVVGAEGVADRV